MKAGLAAMAEAARILGQVRQQLGGSLLVTAHGQHEDPVAPHELHAPMLALFRDRVLGDAAIIAEGPAHEMVIAGKGLCVFDLSFVRDGEPVHEVMWSDRVPNPIMGIHAFLGKVERRAVEWRTRPDPLLGPETYFVGAVEGGDYFNRIPTRCRIQGSRRYPPERTFQDVHAELHGLVREVEVETGLRGELRTMPSGQGFRVDPNQRIVQSVRHAYRQVVGGEQPLVGMALIGNASQFNTLAGIPTVYHGVDQTTAHSDFEHVALDDVERTAKVLVAAAVDYLGHGIGA
jgi:acetylornithine deacetylase/succinyl-diaminopimelate desuccinylase-like protein